MDGKGRSRTRGKDGAADTARVVDQSVAFDCPERQYRARGYKPDFEDLAWSADVDPAQVQAPTQSRPRWPAPKSVASSHQ
jgi:hypothetical protein